MCMQSRCFRILISPSLVTQNYLFHSIQYIRPPAANRHPISLTTTLNKQVRALCRTLRSAPYNLPTAIISIDDLYLPHTQLLSLASRNPNTPLIQHRGQPSTHDLPLAIRTFSTLRQGLPTKIPAFDKSAFYGQGDRLPEAEWEEVNAVEDGEEGKVKVVIYEGWCVGFRALDEETLRERWEDAVRRREKGGYVGRLGHVEFEDVRFVNEALRGYDALTECVRLSLPL